MIIVAGLKSPVRKRSKEIIILIRTFSRSHAQAFIDFLAREKERLFYSTKVLMSLLVTVINLNLRPHSLTLDA